MRTDDYVYAEQGNGDKELYDLGNDPFELQSRHADPGYSAVRASLDSLLAHLTSCAGKGCGNGPKLRLKLSYKRGHDSRGRCVEGGVGATISGGDAAGAISAGFRVRERKAGADGKQPLKRKIGRKRLSRRAKNPVGATVAMLDGRHRSLRAGLPHRCVGSR